MPGFQIKSDYKLQGDQPQAVDQLVQGLKQGHRYQTLLGATGTGKSVAWDEPVSIHLGGDRYYRGPIGKLIDSVVGKEQLTGSVELATPAGWHILAWDAATGCSEWRPLSALSRHESPSQLYKLTTSCGRTVTVTGDHSVWVLRCGQLHLIQGDDVTLGDALPVPTSIPAPDHPLNGINLLAMLEGAGTECASVDVRAALDDRRTILREVLRNHYPGASHCKMWALRHDPRTRGVRPAAATALLERGGITLAEVRLSAKSGTWPAELPVTEALGTICGLYLAEGHAADRFALLSVRDAEVQAELQRCLTSCGIPSFRRPDGDFVIGTRMWRNLLAYWMGDHAQNKRMPEFWPAVDNTVLASMLRGYFEGDGGVERGGVTAVTLSKELAADVVEAVLRFGIWARVRQVQKRKPNGEYGQYYRITISGAENLARFQEEIGFISVRKGLALASCVKERGNTNVDLVYGVGPRLLAERERLGLLQREVAMRAGCTRTMISAIECGKRHPSRELFRRICAALNIKDPAFRGLAEVHWSPVAQVETCPASSPYVYDFSVEGFETFLTGRGGLFVHNTFSMANVIERVQRPALVIAHNKTLAAQLCSEFREFFPDNAVEYFVSYYDYYQPEAYIPQSDTYIEKDAQINDEIDRLRHSATQAILERRDVIIVASVSCIYGLGSPEEYSKIILSFRRGETLDREEALHRLVDMQFTRNNLELQRGTFRVRGDILEVQPIDEEIIIRTEFFGDEIEKITLVDPLTGEVLGSRDSVTVFPASHFVTSAERLEQAIVQIEEEMKEQVAKFTAENKLIEAQRIEQRTRFDIEMMRELGYCSGIENYSRYMDGRAPGTPPNTLFNYFPEDFLVIVDESHQTIPQLRGMYAGDMSRKDTLVEFGFRLPSARDNRPLKFHEWEERAKQCIFVSATPGPFERENSAQIVQQIIRPTGLIDPEIIVRPTRGQIDDLIGEIRKRAEKHERMLVTTLTKRMAEDLTEYLEELNVKVHYLHSDIKTLERTEILRDLRAGVYDVVVGINLLREGLDLPEVSLVAILDADKEGFLRSDTALVQTIGRAARNVGGQVIMYADNITGSMERAISETNRRRQIQQEYNQKHGITPQTVSKAIRELISAEYVAEEKAGYKTRRNVDPAAMPLDQVVEVIADLEQQMRAAAKALDFEQAAQLRDEILELKRFVPSHAMGGADHKPARLRRNR